VWHCGWNQEKEEKPKVSMIGASLNCRGVGKKGMSIYLADLIKDQQLDFIGLQETIKKDYSPAFLRRIDPGGEFDWKWISSVGRSGGILGGFRLSRFTICDTSVGRFHIKVSLLDLKINVKWCLIIVYGAAQASDKEDFLVELGNICSNQNLPILVGGDFNLLRFSSEKNKAMIHSNWSDIFNSIINTCALREIHMTSGQFTWSNNHSDPTLEKLDRFLMSSSWEDLFPLVTVHKLVRDMSDHNPLILDTLDIKVKKKRLQI
jgi:exonuclease III